MTNKTITLSEGIQKSLNAMGYTSLTPIQEKIIPLLFNGDSVIASASTGSGKTASFCIPLIMKAKFEDSDPSALIIAPTRELSMQISEECKSLGMYSSINCVNCTGKEDIKIQANKLKNKSHIVVGTPGRLLDLMRDGILSTANIQTIVLDEADQLMTLGLIDQVKEIFYQFSDVQVCLFSATLKDTKTIDSFFFHTPVSVQLDENESVKTNITQYYLQTDNKFKSLVKLLRTLPIESAVVFVNMRSDVEALAKTFVKEGLLIDYIHGGMDQKKRNKVIHKFKHGEIRVLIASDVAARGLDIQNVTHIINYDLPDTIETYIHRSGRSGRLSNNGMVISLVKNESSSVCDYIVENSEPYTLRSEQAQSLKKTVAKTIKKEKIFDQTTTLFIRAGKKDKVRTIDIVGALSSVMDGSLIGVIEIQDMYSTVTLLTDDPTILDTLADLKIKGKKRKIEIKKK